MSGLSVALERPLPVTLPAGTTTAVWVTGTCVADEAAVTELTLVAGRERRVVEAVGMLRRDGAGRLAPVGFWGSIPVAPSHDDGGVEVRLEARLTGGVRAAAALGTILAAPAATPPSAPRPGLVAVCLATFEPDERLFAAQVESLRAQRDVDWICVVSDDGSSAAHLERIGAVLGDDERFRLSPAGRRLGFYRNFERALGLVPPEAELVALCDQDDVWHPDKLATLRDALGTARLVYSDQRLVDEGGGLLRDTLWRGRRNNHDDVVSMLVANTITGAAMLMRRDLARLALPFPDPPGFQFHDGWLSLLALAAGDVAYVDRPLYDYVQHAGAVFGDVTRGARRRRRRASSARAAYFYGYAARRVMAETALLRCRDRIAPGRRRALGRYLAAERDPRALAWLALRPLRALGGRTETLGGEGALVRGLLWRRAAAVRGLRRLIGETAVPPPDAYDEPRLRRWRARI